MGSLEPRGRTQDGFGDDVEIQPIELEAAASREAIDAAAHVQERVLGEVDQRTRANRGRGSVRNTAWPTSTTKSHTRLERRQPERSGTLIDAVRIRSTSSESAIAVAPQRKSPATSK